ncbi:MAG TPA: selenocysteine-specific translation elongation factor [Mycobacteriales bacterium]|nr:selenocysteine-specific translation elongation factor [Mycobacteriales bacterium]
MHVIATAGHVDHGKSTLVRALTGMEPDRWAEERRRGLTIDLGFAWTRLPSGDPVAFVDVPGHERFVTNMLAGVGPLPAVLMIVAADEGWMPQTEEHAQAIAALPWKAVALVVTKCDLSSPTTIADDATRRLEKLGISPVATAFTSVRTGAGLDDVRRVLHALVAATPVPDREAPVRFWIDRVFTVRGAGTVVTGTLAAGSLRAGDVLQVAPSGADVVIRGMQCLHEDVTVAQPVARVALNLRGVDRDDLHRGMALVSPGRWTVATEVDVVCADPPRASADLVTHIGSASIATRLRVLGAHAARLRLVQPLPLHIGDRLLLRDPASRRLVAADVADLAPAVLRRRGAAAQVARALAVPRDADEEVGRRGVCARGDLIARGFTTPPTRARLVGDQWVANSTWDAWREQLAGIVETATDGLPVAAAARQLRAPSNDVVIALTGEVATIEHVDGRLRRSSPGVGRTDLAPLMKRLVERPYDPPAAEELATLGVRSADLSRAVRDGLAVRLAAGLVLSSAAVDDAIATLRALPAPFTVADARTALGSTRRIVVPLLEHLDARRCTLRHPDGTRTVVAPA